MATWNKIGGENISTGVLIIVGNLMAFYGPVSACQFLGKELLLTGDGPYLSVWDLVERTCVFRRQVLSRACDRIHLIVNPVISGHHHSSSVIVGGGRELAVVSLTKPIGDEANSKNLKRKIYRYVFFDRILDMVAYQSLPTDADLCDQRMTCPNAHSITILAILAHGQVMRLSFQPEATIRLLSKAVLNSHSLFYSAKLVLNNLNDNSNLLYGTIFEGVKMGNCSGPALDAIHINRVMRETEGSIFSVDYDHLTGTIAAVSDDRTLRIWLTSQSDMEGKPISLIGWGHAARVWRVKMFNPKRTLNQDQASLLSESAYQTAIENLQIFTASEDGTVRCWKIIWTADEKKLECYRILRGINQNIWCIDYIDEWLVAGGDDGSIRIWHCGNNRQAESASGPNAGSITERTCPSNSLGGHGEIKSFQLGMPTNNNNDIMYLAYEDGSVWKQIDDQVAGNVTHHYPNFQPIYANTDLERYSVMALSESKQYLVLGGLNGKLHIILMGSECQQTVEPIGQAEKIIGVWTFSSLAEELIIIWTIASGKAYLWKKRTNQTIYLSTLEEEKVTQVTMISDQSLLVVGTRNGKLVALDMANLTKLADLQLGKDAITSIKEAGLGLAHSSAMSKQLLCADRGGCLYKIRLNKSSECEFQIVLVMLEKTRIFPGWIEQIDLISRNEMKKEKILIGGFHQKHFILFDATEKIEVARVFCAGPHRQWRLGIEAGCSAKFGTYSYRWKFVYWRLGQLHVESGWNDVNAIERETVQNLGKTMVDQHAAKLLCENVSKQNDNHLGNPNQQSNFIQIVLRPFLHGGEIRSLAIIFVENKQLLQPKRCKLSSPMDWERRQPMVVSGGEDGQLRGSWIVKSENKACEINPNSAISLAKAHKSGIRSVWVSKDGSWIVTGGGAGELKVWRMEVDGDGEATIRSTCVLERHNARRKDSISNGIDEGLARIMNVDGYLEQTNHNDSPTSGKLGNQTIIIVAGYSDSYVAVWKIEAGVGKLVAEMETHTGHCLQRVKWIWPQWGIFCSTGTDGAIITYQIKSNLPFFETPNQSADGMITILAQLYMHQSGINGFDCCNIIAPNMEAQSAESVIITTGGDDGAIGMAKCTIVVAPTSYNQMDSLVLETRLEQLGYFSQCHHDTSVTGVVFIKPSSKAIFLTNDLAWIGLISVGIDQRVRRWRVGVSLDAKTQVAGIDKNFGLELVASQFTSVADPSSIALLNNSDEPPSSSNLWRADLIIGGIGMEWIQYDREETAI